MSQEIARPVNRLLRRLSTEDFALCRADLRPIQLEVKYVLYEPDQPIEYAYFLEAGMGSVTANMADGSAIEVGTIGNEGLIGSALLLGTDQVPHKCFMQVAGHGFRIAAQTLVSAAGQSQSLRILLLRYHAAFHAQVGYVAACNGLHTVHQRCCRWLLITADRLDSKQLPLTHEFLGVMLGVRRASVSEVLQPLQEQGLIRYGRGTIDVLDRNGLEAETCECYAVMRREMNRLLD